MKKIVLMLLLLLSLAATAHADLTKITENIYSYVGVPDASPANSFAANAGIIIGRDSILVVDTLISAKEAERFLKDIRKVSQKPIQYVVNTHTHLDHAFGNSVFAKLGATIICQADDALFLQKNGASTLKNIGTYGLRPEEMAGTEIVSPAITFGDTMTIDMGNLQVQLIHLGPSHTEGSLVVLVPSRKVVFAGDILFTDFHPYLAGADLNGWNTALNQLLAMDVDKIVPGHGPLSSKKDLRDMKEYLIVFDAQAKELFANSPDIDANAAELKKILPRRSQAEWMIPFNLKARYLRATP